MTSLLVVRGCLLWTGSIARSRAIPPRSISYNSTQYLVNLEPACDSITLTRYFPYVHYFGTAIWRELHAPDPYGNLQLVHFQSLVRTETTTHLFVAYSLCLFGDLQRMQQHGVTAHLLQMYRRRASSHTATRRDNKASHVPVVCQTSAKLRPRFHGDVISKCSGM
jgi:hypothetical protein